MDFLCIIHTHDPIRKDTVSICLYFIATKQIGTSKNVILGKGKDIKIWTCSLFLVCTICYNFILFNDVRISFWKTNSLKMIIISPNKAYEKSVMINCKYLNNLVWVHATNLEEVINYHLYWFSAWSLNTMCIS